MASLRISDQQIYCISVKFNCSLTRTYTIIRTVTLTKHQNYTFYSIQQQTYTHTYTPEQQTVVQSVKLSKKWLRVK